jgi:hypothetical protein
MRTTTKRLVAALAIALGLVRCSLNPKPEDPGAAPMVPGIGGRVSGPAGSGGSGTAFGSGTGGAGFAGSGSANAPPPVSEGDSGLDDGIDGGSARDAGRDTGAVRH